MNAKLPVIAVVGPTAVGKTAFSIALAQRINGEIISGDSMQVYRHLSIGTAKATAEERQAVPHHLLDVCDESEAYNASQFQQQAQRCIVDISDRQRVPIVVGGTGLYIEGLLTGLTFGGRGSTVPELRQQLLDEAERIGAQALWQRLEACDPVAAAAIPWQNVRRTVRALEVMERTGKLFSQQSDTTGYPYCLIGLTTDRSVLYDRINQRVDQMMHHGLEAEARWLWEQPIAKDLPAKRGIGYQQLFDYFEGRCTKEEAVAAIKQQSRRYAKRQLTWFRNRMRDVQWFDVVQKGLSEQEAALAYATQFLAQQKQKGV